jgi:hypothetical protein
VAGCQFPRGLTREDLESSPEDVQVRTVRLIDGTELDFRSDPLGYGFVRDSVLVRSLSDGSFTEIPLDSIQFEESTRHPTGQENALNSVMVGAIVIVLLCLALDNADIDFH